MRRVGFLSVVMALAVLAAACVQISVPPPLPDPFVVPPPPPGLEQPPAGSPVFTETVVLDELTAQIWDLAFTPDDHMLLSVRDTGVAVFREGDEAFNTGPGGRPEPRVIREISNRWATGAESGVLGLDVHPDFATNRYVYVCYTSLAPSARVRLFRYTVSPDYTALTNDLELIPGGVMTGQPPNGFHHGCRPKFQPGASPPALFVTIGDGGVGTAPQDLGTSAGKVLRLTDLGSPYPGNPFGGETLVSRVFTYGHRNPQGIAFSPEGQIYTAEHGPNVDDEVNRLVAGGNGGWNPVPGYNQSVPMTDLFRYPAAMIPVWRSASPTLALSGMTLLRHDNWASWKGAIVVATLKARRLVVMFRNSGGSITATWTQEIGQESFNAFGRYPRLRTAVEDADGNLWIPTDHPYHNPIVSPQFHDVRPGQLIKLTPTPPGP